MTERIIPQDGDAGKFLEGPDGDFLREAVRKVVQELMEAELTSKIGAGRSGRLSR